MGRHKKEYVIDTDTSDDVVHRLRISQDSIKTVAIIDVADIVPFSAFRSVDEIFPKLGLLIKRQFGYLGYSWGYGEVKEVREGDTYPEHDAPVSLHIYFQQGMDDGFLAKNADGFAKIVAYLNREWGIYSGSVADDL